MELTLWTTDGYYRMELTWTKAKINAMELLHGPAVCSLYG
nr:hypothetical protein Q903MT_gene1606 [Picea sitchensis]